MGFWDWLSGRDKWNEAELLREDQVIRSEQQLEAILWGFYGRVCRTRDRRAANTKVETPDGQLDMERSEIHPVNQATGLPESANSLLPAYKAVSGKSLAKSLIIPPRDFVLSFIYTDELPENFNAGPDNREWRCLAMVPPDMWSAEAIEAVNENTLRLKLVVHRLSQNGLFLTRPRIDEHDDGELGTDHLMHGEDDLTMGFQITWEGIKAAEEFLRRHPRFANGHSILDAMGKTFAQQAPEWLHRELRHSAQEVLAGGF